MQILFFCEDSSGEPNFAERNFWHASCSARGVYIDGSMITTLFFYASLWGVCSPYFVSLSCVFPVIYSFCITQHVVNPFAYKRGRRV
uniref:Membrane protein n=1 Tax=Human herpesvirus 3 TaxID=10335 RepID=G9IWX3_HHV3|nr:membrane protein [Human alphaherpesvirus 3]